MSTWNQQQQQPWEEEDPNAAWAGYAPTAPAAAVPAAQWQQQPPSQQQYYPQQQWQQPAPAANWNQPPQQQQWQQPLPPNPHQQWNAPKISTVPPPPVVDWTPPALNDPMLNAGLQAGKAFMDQQLGASLGSATQSYTSYTAQLKALYFNVNNAYVLAKLRTLLFPFTQKQWNVCDGDGEDLGKKDVNAPDLYLPLMALSTYVLAVGLAKGTTHVFNPEIIVEVFGSSVFSQALQVVVIKMALYLLVGQNMQVSWLDLLAYTGYQYIGVAINMLVGVCFGPVAYNLCLVWTAACAAFVMFKTMQQVVGGTTAGSQKKLYFVVLCAALQVAHMWFLGFTRDLRSSNNNLAVDVFGGNSVQIPATTMAFPEETVQQHTSVVEEDDYEESEAVKARKAKRRANKKQQKAAVDV